MTGASLAGPKRIQRQRTKGWRMPEGAVYVGRPSRWGNPWRVVPVLRTAWDHGTPYAVVDEAGNSMGTFRNADRARYWAQLGFRQDFMEDVTPLRGFDLACWCPIGRPCHADVLLELANLGAGSAAEGAG